MAAHVERLPTEKDGIGAEVFSNLLRVERIKLLAVFPVKQFRVFRLQKPAGRSKRHVPLNPVEPGHSLTDGYSIGMLPALGKVLGGNHAFALLSPL